jgi:flavin reductase (DIM6/NTAB) family NADH-FMN oxidoreductase RutF
VAGGDELREVMRRYPVGVSVVAVDLEGERLGVTVASLCSLALEPPLVSISIAHQASLHELLRAAGGYAVSMLAADQLALAQHFARGVPPIAMWHGIATVEGAAGAPLHVGALGWLECVVEREIVVGTHTFFVCAVRKLELGEDAPPLVRVRGAYVSA